MTKVTQSCWGPGVTVRIISFMCKGEKLCMSMCDANLNLEE